MDTQPKGGRTDAKLDHDRGGGNDREKHRHNRQPGKQDLLVGGLQREPHGNVDVGEFTEALPHARYVPRGRAVEPGNGLDAKVVRGDVSRLERLEVARRVVKHELGDGHRRNAAVQVDADAPAPTHLAVKGAVKQVDGIGGVFKRLVRVQDQLVGPVLEIVAKIEEHGVEIRRNGRAHVAIQVVGQDAVVVDHVERNEDGGAGGDRQPGHDFDAVETNVHPSI